MDTGHLVIDLTDAAMARRRATTCARCSSTGELYRLIGTPQALCHDCFTDVHVEA